MAQRAALLALLAFSSLTAAGAAEPRRVELKQDVPVVVAGVALTLKSVLYAHLSGSRNNSMMVLEARRGDQRITATLTRLEPGPPVFTSVLGLELAIDYVDAYHAPVTGAVLYRER